MSESDGGGGCVCDCEEAALEEEDLSCNVSLVLNMSFACVSGVCDGGEEYGDMCGE